MSNVQQVPAVVNLHADEWQAREVAQFATYALRQPGSIATLVGDIQARAYKVSDNARIWVVEDAQGAVLAEEPSLYRAIHKIAR